MLLLFCHGFAVITDAAAVAVALVVEAVLFSIFSPFLRGGMNPHYAITVNLHSQPPPVKEEGMMCSEMDEMRLQYSGTTHSTH